MDLERGALARLDRRLLAGLDREERFQMVRVPVTPAAWSTWKRYCDIAGILMGRAVAALIDHELTSVLSDSSDGPGLEERAQRQVADREAALTKREDELAEAEDRVRRRSEHLRVREREMEARERRLEVAKRLADQSAVTRAKTGRNERCPCGSGLKYKHLGMTV
ncbi:MAG: SEC-C domain-containing protein [Acidimicrobiia bacterium]